MKKIKIFIIILLTIIEITVFNKISYAALYDISYPPDSNKGMADYTDEDASQKKEQEKNEEIKEQDKQEQQEQESEVLPKEEETQEVLEKNEAQQENKTENNSTTVDSTQAENAIRKVKPQEKNKFKIEWWHILAIVIVVISIIFILKNKKTKKR